MAGRKLLAGVGCVALICCASCMSHQRQIKSSALDFLYPKGGEAVPPRDVNLQLPLRVGLAFAPQTGRQGATFDETQKQALLERVAEAFRDHEGIRDVEAIPTSYLEPGGGFANLDKLVSAFGIDIMAMISYDQFQFSESGRSSWAYWTLIGAYVVKGEKNETRTLMDAVIYDIPSRAMLFHASGQSSLSGRATPVEVGKSMRKASEEGFLHATDDLISNLDRALESFAEQAASGTVRGEGTPAIAMVDESGQPLQSGEGGGGAGSLGASEVFVALLLLLPAMAQRRRRRPSI